MLLAQRTDVGENSLPMLIVFADSARNRGIFGANSNMTERLRTSEEFATTCYSVEIVHLFKTVKHLIRMLLMRTLSLNA